MGAPGLGSIETYLNPRQYNRRGQTWAQPLLPGTHTYTARTSLVPNAWELRGTWNATSQAITPVGADASILGGFLAAHVYLVMTSAGNTPRQVQVLLNGRPYATVTVSSQHLYTLVSRPRDHQGALSVQIPAGVSAYDFTFG